MRYLAKSLLKDLSQQMVLLSGPRQCGKTTLSKWLLKEKLSGEYLNWDQIKDRKRISQQDWSEDTDLLVLDEIHKKSAWKTFLKGIYDTKPSRLHLLVTGSARLEFFQRSGDSMFGRYRPWRLHPFCLAEDPLGLSANARFERQLIRGGFPTPYLAKTEEEAQKWRNLRWNLLLREDTRDLTGVKDLQALELLAELLKDHAAGMLSFANIAEDAEVAPKTAKDWIRVLEKLYLVFLISPYTGSIKRALSKTPKLYFSDPGDLIDQDIGKRVENLVAINLIKRVNYIEDAYGDRIGLQYLRDKERREVDFVITLKRRPVALIEVKNSYQDLSSSLLYFKKNLGVSSCIQLHADSKRKAMIKNGVKIISIQEFFSSDVSARTFWEVA